MGSLKKGINTVGVLCSFVLAMLPLKVLAANDSPLLISRLQTGSKTSASEEFVEVANVSGNDVDLANWQLQYFAATAKDFNSPTRTIPLKSVISSNKRFIAASNNYMLDQAGAFFSSTFASAGGHVRLVSVDSNKALVQQDLVGWGTAGIPLGQAAPAPPAGNTLERKTDTTGLLVQTGNNAQDFAVPSSGGNGGGDIAPLANPGQAALVQITELLPNPASPQTDSKDEYIELYNPNAEAVQLAGYKLLTGNTLNHSYTFEDQSIAPDSYKAFYVTETKASLTNSGGKARLLGPDGSIVNESESYGAADDGDAWAWDGAVWQWTTSPTPGQPNVITEKAIKDSSSSKKAASTKKASTSKAKTSSAKATKGAKTGSTTTDGSQSGGQSSNSSPVLHPAVLAGVGGLAVLYGAYEYRHDVANAYHKFRRRNRKASRAVGAKA